MAYDITGYISINKRKNPLPSHLRSPRDVANVMEKYKNKEQEHVALVTVTTANTVIKVHLITIGAINYSIIDKAAIFRACIKDNAKAFFLCHNHPSGELTPSRKDIDVTNDLIKAGDLMQIKLLDHIIISKKGFCSLLSERLCDF